MRTRHEVTQSIARRSVIEDPDNPAFVRSGQEAAETLQQRLEGSLPGKDARVLPG